MEKSKQFELLKAEAIRVSKIPLPNKDALQLNMMEDIRNSMPLRCLAQEIIDMDELLKIQADEIWKHFDRMLLEKPIELPEDWSNNFEARYYEYGIY